MSFARRLVLGTILVLVLTVADPPLGRRAIAPAGPRGRHRARASSARRGSSARRCRPTRSAGTRRCTGSPAPNGHRITLVDRHRPRARRQRLPAGPAARDREPCGPARGPARARAAGRAWPPAGARRSGRQLMYVAVPGGPGVVRVAGEPGPGGRDRPPRAGRGGRRGAARAAGRRRARARGRRGRSRGRSPTLATAARAIAAGSPPRFPRSGIPEIDVLVQALRQMHRQLGDRFDELRARAGGVGRAGRIDGRRGDRGRRAGPHRDRQPGRAAAAGLRRRRSRCPTCRRCSGSRPRARWWTPCSQGRPVQDRQLEMDGRVFLVNARPLPAGGAVLVLHDLTEVRRLEAVRRDFVANVSHELKTPLTSISGYAETLLGDPPDAETTRRFLATILSNAQADAAAGGRPARPVAHRVGPLAARAARTWMWPPWRASRGPRWRTGRTPHRVELGARRRARRRRRRRGSRRAAPDPHQPDRQLAALHAAGRPHHLPEPAGRRAASR